MKDIDVVDFENYCKAKRKAVLKNNLKEVANLCNALGAILARQGNFEDALEEHKQELAACVATDDIKGVAIAQRKIGECYSELGNYEEALNFQQKYLELAQETNDIIEEQRAYATIGRTYLFQAEPLIQTNSSVADDFLDQAEEAFLKSMGICNRLREKIPEKEFMEMKSRLYLNLGLVSDYKGNIENCTDFIKKAIHINMTHDLKDDLHRCHFSLAQILRRQGNFSKALRHLDDAYAVAEKLKDKELQCETLLCKAQVLLILDDYTGARLYLKKAFKFNTSNRQDKQEIKRFLKHATNLCRVEDSLVPLSDDDYKNRLPLYEKLGDTFAAVSNFKQALEYYHKTLKCAEMLGHGAATKAPLYYSIAQTYMDLKQYSDAIDYFEKEIDCRSGNYKEECKTLLNISDCELLRGEVYTRVNEILQTALEKAIKANKPFLQMNCLKALICAQKKFERSDEQAATFKELSNLKEEHALSSDDESTSNCGSSQNTQTVETSDISDLSDSDDDMEEYDCPKRNTGSRNISNKRNEKGETPLHRACIAGNLNQVRHLVEKGHPVNPRDNCGWLPLHEAANHDFYDIVEYLLDHGAWVNDRGGVYCDGITPLHDASCCGNIKVMRLLVERGASVVAKTNDGETPLDCLVKWRNRAGEEISRDLLNECRNMEDNLKEMMKKLGHSVPIVKDSLFSPCSPVQKSRLQSDTSSESDDDLMPPVTVVKKCQKKKRSAELLYSSEDEATLSQSRQYKSRKKNDDEIYEPFDSVADGIVAPSQDTGSLSDSEDIYPVSSPRRSSDLDDCSQARQEYINAISSMRSATARLGEPHVELISTEKSGKSAMIDEREIIVDDWLVEDVGQPSSSSKKKDDEALFAPSRHSANKQTLHNFISRYESSTNRPINKKSYAKPFKQNKLRQTKLQTIAQSSENCNLQDLELPQYAKVLPSALSKDVEHASVTKNDLPTTVGSLPGAPLRLKVRIQDKLLLVPVTQNNYVDQTVSWLAEEAANRYYSLNGLKPVLRLSTVEGAALTDHDRLVDLFHGNEEVLATIQHWDLPPLAERYVTSCQSLNSVVYSNVKSALQSASDSRILVLDNMGLKPEIGSPLFRALKCQYGLRHLSLGGNCLGDEGLKMLASALTTLPNLLTLNICCNSLTRVGLQALVSSITDSQKSSNLTSAVKPLQLLTDLNLSYNFLGDSCSSVLGELIQGLPSLVGLQTSSCNITQQAFSSNKSQLAIGLKAAVHLCSLDMAYNSLGVTGVGHLLKYLSVNRLTVLILTSVVKKCSPSESTIFGQYLKTYMMQGDCCLEELYLDDCSLTDDCVCIFAVGLKYAVHLRILSLATNPKLTVSTIAGVTDSLKDRKIGILECLDVSGCLSILKLTTSYLLKLFPFWTVTEDQRTSLTLKLSWNPSERSI